MDAPSCFVLLSPGRSFSQSQTFFGRDASDGDVLFEPIMTVSAQYNFTPGYAVVNLTQPAKPAPWSSSAWSEAARSGMQKSASYPEANVPSPGTVRREEAAKMVISALREETPKTGTPGKTGMQTRKDRKPSKLRNDSAPHQKRWFWPADLHRHFVNAFEFYCAEGSSRELYDRMKQMGADMSGLTLEQVRSHQQKYRIKLAKQRAKGMTGAGITTFPLAPDAILPSSAASGREVPSFEQVSLYEQQPDFVDRFGGAQDEPKRPMSADSWLVAPGADATTVDPSLPLRAPAP